ncbi:MAG: glycine zipper family protein [Sedimenticola sp.]
MRRAAPSLVATAYLVSILTGCETIETRKPFVDSLPPDIGTIGVSLIEAKPEIDIEVPTRSKAEGLGEGASSGGATGALIGAQVAVQGGAVGILLAPYLIGTGLIIGTIAGGVYGLANSENAETVIKAEAAIHSATSTVPVQQRLQNKVAYFISSLTKRDVRIIPADESSNIDMQAQDQTLTIPPVVANLELSITDIKSEGGFLGNPTSLVLLVETRLIRTNDNELLFEGDYQFNSLGRKLPEWASNDAEAVYQAYERAIHTIANEIVHEHFLLYYAPEELIPKEPPPKAQTLGYTSWTNDIGDKNKTEDEKKETDTWKPRWDGSYLVELVEPIQKYFIFTPKVDSLTPVFRWRVFPQPIDKKRDPGDVISRIDNVVYDLEIYNVSEESPREAVHYQHGLTENEYRIPRGLKVCRKYAWSVRARFNLGPYMRSTEWAGSYFYPRTVRNRSIRTSKASSEKVQITPTYPIGRFQLFKTPCPPKKPEILQE